MTQTPDSEKEGVPALQLADKPDIPLPFQPRNQIDRSPQNERQSLSNIFNHTPSISHDYTTKGYIFDTLNTKNKINNSEYQTKRKNSIKYSRTSPKKTEFSTDVLDTSDDTYTQTNTKSNTIESILNLYRPKVSKMDTNTMNTRGEFDTNITTTDGNTLPTSDYLLSNDDLTNGILTTDGIVTTIRHTNSNSYHNSNKTSDDIIINDSQSKTKTKNKTKTKIQSNSNTNNSDSQSETEYPPSPPDDLNDPLKHLSIFKPNLNTFVLESIESNSNNNNSYKTPKNPIKQPRVDINESPSFIDNTYTITKGFTNTTNTNNNKINSKISSKIKKLNNSNNSNFNKNNLNNSNTQTEEWIKQIRNEKRRNLYKMSEDGTNSEISGQTDISDLISINPEEINLKLRKHNKIKHRNFDEWNKTINEEERCGWFCNIL